MMIFEKGDIFVNNVAIVQSQDTTSLTPIAISVQDFLSFAGDTSQTVTLAAAPQLPSQSTLRTQALGLFGSWEEDGNEDHELQDLYKSRLMVSSLPADDE